MRIRAATRASALARWQTDHVAALLAPLGVTVETVAVSTTGDRRQDVPIHAMGGKGVFVKEVQRAVLDGRADIAVHSMKDLPSVATDGLVLAAVPRRGDPRDALVGCRLDALPEGADVATGSIRRRAQLAARRPDLVFHELRGNIATRLRKAADFDAVIMAAVALQRLGAHPAVVDVLDPDVMLPQVGQGALAVEAGEQATDVLEVLGRIEHAPSRALVDTERAFLAELGGDCDLPAGAHAVRADDATVRLRSLIAAPDGSVVLIDDRRGPDGVALGVQAAQALLERGGADLLDRGP